MNGASFDVFAVYFEGAYDDAHRGFGDQVLRAELYDAWCLAGGGRKNRGEVEVVREHHEAVSASPGQEFIVGRGGRADGGPVDGLELVPRQPANPARRQVHVHQQLHGRPRETSTSSARHAA